MVIFGPDASKWQGDVNWADVDVTCAFGWEKVTEGTSYISERWRPEKPGMLARARQSGFIPGGYLFLSEGNGARQADHFADAAGDMSEFAIAVDVEPREPSSHPSMADARACVARLRARYPGHPIGGYIPKWYWGTRDTTFVDYLWASHYVDGSAPPETLYRRVTGGMWAGYGGSQVSLLQFTDKALIRGVSGPCDCSAYRGTPAELHRILLGRTPAKEAKPVPLKRVWIPSPNHQSRGAAAVRLIVLHTTEGAQSYQSLGAFFGNPASQVSSHVGIDDTPGTVGEYVKRDRAAWTGAGANNVAVQGEFCTPSGAADGWSRQTWTNQHRNMLVNAAAWIREEAQHFSIPVKALSPGQPAAGAAGVCQHSDLGAWGGGHHDCGPGFPMDIVISLAKGGTATITEGDDLMQQAGFMDQGQGAVTPVAIPNNAKRLRLFSNQAAEVKVDWIGKGTGETVTLNLSYDIGPLGAAIPDDCHAVVLRRIDAGLNLVSFVLMS